MNNRDLEYIENRLIVPAGQAVEAIGRLRQVGYDLQADKLMEATKAFIDVCREIRKEVVDRHRGIYHARPEAPYTSRPTVNEQNPAYRNEMRDAGRGGLLR